MIIYLLIGFIVCSFGIVSELLRGRYSNPARTKTLPVLAIGLVLTTFSGLRFEVGTDFNMYANMFAIVDPDSLQNSLKLIPQEAGFVTLMFLLRQFTEDSVALFSVAAALTVFPVLITVRRLSSSPALSVFLYFFFGFYTVSMNAVRQSIAVSFMFLGETYRERSKTKWIICAVLAATFHSSAILAFLIQLVITHWKPTVFSSAILLIAGPPLVFLAVQNPFILETLGGLNERYMGYLLEEGVGIGTILIIFSRVLIIIVSFFAKSDSQNNRFLAYVIISTMILMLGIYSWVFTRLEPYFGIYLVLLVPAVLRNLKHRKLFIFCAIPIGILYFWFHTTAYNGLLPYQLVTS